MQELPIKVECIVFHGNQKDDIHVLAVKRSPEDGGFWQPITGTLHDGESLEECLIRELSEETGILVEHILEKRNFFYSFQFQKGTIWQTEFVSAVAIHPNTPIILSEEHTEYRWVSIPDALTLFPKENNKNALREFVKTLS